MCEISLVGYYSAVHEYMYTRMTLSSALCLLPPGPPMTPQGNKQKRRIRPTPLGHTDKPHEVNRLVSTSRGISRHLWDAKNNPLPHAPAYGDEARAWVFGSCTWSLTTLIWGDAFHVERCDAMEHAQHANSVTASSSQNRPGSRCALSNMTTLFHPWRRGT